jgi:hypothetical protein
MSRRMRVLSFGSAVALIVAGVVVDGAITGIGAEAVAIALMSLGGIGVVALLFLEVGLSEDRERARERAQAREPRPAATPQRPLRTRRPPRRRRPG